ncbi:Uncharacterised protein [Mycobacteroides abscessus subsp. abscessus]|uniref:hypothetical protein n=1 Tax=Mycobacteroides abscessus TaxID=36809 RepID=UPI0009270230|nr:hypothetical protein [Mycobacteroides abscessus]SHS99208.1 Uncharacterised protein [Mycobacteroides abscessus subsp. abscessus]
MADASLTARRDGISSTVDIRIDYHTDGGSIRSALIKLTNAYDEAREHLASLLGDDD